MTTGKNIKNRRQKSSPSDKRLATDFNGSLQFIHEMSGGEVEFDLQELVLPSGSGSFTNPTPETIRSLNLANLRERIKLFNGEGKAVPYGQHFEVMGTKIVLKGITAGVGEIFFGEIKNVPRQNIQFFDGIQNQTTKFLTPGETQLNVGFPIPLGGIDTSVDRIGPVDVHRQREIQYLNTDYLTADVSADGDYAFVDDGFGESSVIEFNNPGALLPGGLPEFVSVKRNAISVDKEDGSLRQEMDVLGGAVDKIADEVSIIQSIPKSDLLNFNASRQQLRQFGDFVQALGLIEMFKPQWQQAYNSGAGTFGSTDLDAFRVEGTNPTAGLDIGSGLFSVVHSAVNGTRWVALKDIEFHFSVYVGSTSNQVMFHVRKNRGLVSEISIAKGNVNVGPADDIGGTGGVIRLAPGETVAVIKPATGVAYNEIGVVAFAKSLELIKLKDLIA